MGDDTSLFGPDWRDAATAEYHSRRRRLTDRGDACRRRIEQAQKELSGIETEIHDLDRGARAFGLAVISEEKINIVGVGTVTVDAQVRHTGSPQFKEVALEALKAAHPKPIKAADIQSFVEAKLGRTFHWKTAGMTLYRFKEDGVVRREGRDWYWVPEEHRAKPTEVIQGGAQMSE